MARPLRIEFAGALYHVTSRGDGREAIYLRDEDRELWLEILGHVCDRFNWLVHAYCQMRNHYHLLMETPDGNLSKGMRQVNGLYTQRFNRGHRRAGHVFQGRYKAILVLSRSRDNAIFKAYRNGAYSMQAIRDYAGLHYSRISRIVGMTERREDGTGA